MKTKRTTSIIVAFVVTALAGIAGTMQVSMARAQVACDYNVTAEDFGADGSDKKADTAAIQMALSKAVGAKETVTIYVPAGDYYIDRWLRIYSNTHLILDEGATIHRMDSIIDKGMVQNVAQDGNMGTVGGYDMSENITIEGGTWDGGNVDKAKDSSDIIRIDHAKNVTIQDCTIKNVYDCHLIELVGVQNGTISGCTLTGFTYRKGHEKDWTYSREAIQLESAWTNNESDKTDKSAMWANGSVIDGTACDNVTVSDNKVIDFPCGIGQHHYTKDGKYRDTNITICNNTITCSKKWKFCKAAITCSGMNQVTISDNQVKGPYRFGTHIAEANDVVVQRNQIDGTKMNGIMVDGGKGISILKNQLKNSTKHGISVGGGTIEEISENTIQNIKVDGIAMNKGTIKLIQNNTITNMKKHGISIVGGTVGSEKDKATGVLKNKITNCGENGISISGGAVSAVNENRITKVKNNGISIIKSAKVYLVTGNTLKKCKKHTVWSGSKKYKTVVRKNKV